MSERYIKQDYFKTYMIDEEESKEETFEGDVNTPEELKLIAEIDAINEQIGDLVEKQDELSGILTAAVTNRRKNNGS